MTSPYDAIILERHRQDRKWGVQNLTDAEFMCVLAEEVGEVANAINDGLTPEHVRKELVQVAAVAVKWLEAMDRRDAPAPEPKEVRPDGC